MNRHHEYWQVPMQKNCWPVFVSARVIHIDSLGYFILTSLSDCYWMKDAEETYTWEQVSLFENPLEKPVTSTALLGTNRTFHTLVQRIHTPEFTAQGMAAKA